MRKAIIFMGLIVFVLAYAGCAEKQITKSGGNGPAMSQGSAALNDINFDFDKSNIRPGDGQILSDIPLSC